MKKLIKHDIGDYTFNPTAKTIVFWGVTITQDQILTITNTTDGTLIYVFADASLGGVFDGTTLTLTYNTASMVDTDALQIYVDIPVDSSPTTLLKQINIDDVTLWQNPNTGELYTQDVNLAQIFGAIPLADSGRLKTKTTFEDFIIKGRIGALQESLGIDCKGLPSVTVQLSGTWVGTVTFEARADDGTFVAIQGQAPSGAALITTTTAGGIFRFNTTGHQRFQVRISAYTSGTVLVALTASSEPGIINIAGPITGSLSQALVQRATTFEQTTYDTNLATVFGGAALYRLGFTAAEQIIAPTVNPTQPTTYAANEYARYPQYFPRARVEAGGDQKLPFAQEMISNRLLVATPELNSTLQEVLMQVKMLNQLTMLINNITPPPGWEEIK